MCMKTTPLAPFERSSTLCSPARQALDLSTPPRRRGRWIVAWTRRHDADCVAVHAQAGEAASKAGGGGGARHGLVETENAFGQDAAEERRALGHGAVHRRGDGPVPGKRTTAEHLERGDAPP